MTTRFLFFSGKGGVGKTSMACTTAVHEADQGKRVLIVTTDPASNLADMFEQTIGHKVTPIQGVPNLWATEIDSIQATREYIDRAMAPIRYAFPEQIIAVMEEQMSGPCTAEVAAFDRFVDFLDIPQAEPAQHTGPTMRVVPSLPGTTPLPSDLDLVIFDTAPTGHTIRLLELPSQWTHSIDEAAAGSGQTCIGPAAAVQDSKHKYERALAIMRDSSRTDFVFVLQPEAISIRETCRAIGELEKLGIHTNRLIINGIIPVEEQTNTLFAERLKMQRGYLAQIKLDLNLPEQFMHLLDGEIKGIKRLREVAQILFESHTQVTPALAYAPGAQVSQTITQLPACIPPVKPLPPTPPTPSTAISRILPEGRSRSLFFTGKGGVGKTAVSCITAIWLARRGYKTLLLTTDPAAHIGDVLGVPITDLPAPVPGVPNLWATRIDPRAAGDAYKARILGDARRRGRPEEAVRVMAEELDSPCTEEMAAFDKFIEYASQDEWEITVFDTAPTGHTLRLLELPVDWSKQLDIKVYSSVDTVAADDVAKGRFARVIDMMKDPALSTFAYVMYPEATPILEAYRASEELKAIGIHPGLVIANQILPAEMCNTRFSKSRWIMQQKYLAEISNRFQVPVLTIPLLACEVKGLGLLARLGDELYGAAESIDARALTPVPLGAK